jgi:hypothetical protein
MPYGGKRFGIRQIPKFEQLMFHTIYMIAQLLIYLKYAQYDSGLN